MTAHGDTTNVGAPSAGPFTAVTRVLLICALSLACNPRAVTPAVHGGSPPSAVPGQAERWRLVRVPFVSSSSASFADSTLTTTRVLFAGSRAEVRAGAVTFARDDTLEAIIRSCPSDGGFLHFTEGGGLFWSRVFLGRLESVGLTRSDLHERIVQCNPVVALSSRGRPTLLVSRSGSRLLGQADLALVHFQTTERAHAVAPPDRLLETTDGGRTFAALATRPSTDLDEPTAWLGSDIDVLDQADDSSEGMQSAADPVRTAWLRREVATEAGRVAGGLVLTDGTWVRWVYAADRWKVLLAFRTPDGRVTDHSIPGSCSVQPYGRRLLCACSQQSLTLSLLGPEGEGSLPAPPHPIRVATADPKGRWIAALAVADAGPKSAGKPLLVVFDGGAWKQYPGLDVTPLAATSRWLVAKRNPGTGGTAALSRSSPSIALLPFAAPANQAYDFGEGVEEGAVNLLDHKLAYIRRTRVGREVRSTLIWRDPESGEEGPAHEIPTEIYRVAFADERHGMAVEGHGGLLVTEDGGQSFTRVPWQGRKPDPRAELRCWSHGCSFAASVAFTDEPLAREPSAVPNPEVALPEASAPSQRPWDDLFPVVPVPETAYPATAVPKYQCRARPSFPTSEVLRQLQVTDPSDPSSMGQIPAVWPIQRKGNAFGWSGRDAAGAFRVETPALTGVAAQLTRGPLERTGDTLYVAALEPVLMARSYAIMVRTQTDIGSRSVGDTVFFILEATGRARVLAKTPPAQGTRAQLFFGRAQAMPLPKGGAAVLVSAPGRQELFELDATGTVVARRWFVGPAGRMALGPDGLSFVIENDDGTRVYSMVRGSAGRDVTWRTRRGLPECRRASPAAPGQTYLVAFNTPTIEIGRDSDPGYQYLLESLAGASLLEIGPGGGCWRSVLVNEPFPITLRATGDGMRGTIIGPDRAHTLLCRRAKP